MYNDAYLSHFGIPGMHWGRRKGPTTTITKTHKSPVITKNGKYFDKKGHEISTDAARKTLLSQKKVREMSNMELKSLNDRMQLERQFSDLKYNDKERKTGLNVVKQVTMAGTTIASLYALSKSPLAQDAIKLIKSKLA